MQIEINDIGDNLRRVTLTGRLDTPGVLGVEPRFVTGLVSGGKNAIVDLSNVDFISSMGIRMFISVARNMKDRQTKLALYAPQPRVDEVLESAAFRQLVPVCKDAAEATALVQR
ncbi:MAG TPA: STAS domain-containing protein [Burkholderiales bacterium]|nr:STAS domain-containing protein [Burkholderiales bacterium]